MYSFEISFTYEGVEHRADVERISPTTTGSAQYIVHNISPKIDFLPECWTLISDHKKEKLSYALNPSYMSFYRHVPQQVVTQIYDYCKQLGISVH